MPASHGTQPCALERLTRLIGQLEREPMPQAVEMRGCVKSSASRPTPSCLTTMFPVARKSGAGLSQHGGAGGVEPGLDRRDEPSMKQRAGDKGPVAVAVVVKEAQGLNSTRGRLRNKDCSRWCWYLEGCRSLAGRSAIFVPERRARQAMVVTGSLGSDKNTTKLFCEGASGGDVGRQRSDYCTAGWRRRARRKRLQ